MKKIFFFIISGTLFITILVGQNNDGQSNLTTKKDSLVSNKPEDKKCMDCHAGLFEKKIKHTTATGKGCEDCHKSNGSEHPKAGVVAFSLADKLPDLCLSCHNEIKDKYANSRLVHHAVDDKKSCVYCHAPHSSTEKKLLVSVRKDLCLSCHNKTITSTSQTLPNMEQQYKNSKVFHPPFQKCSKACHNPHGSDNYRLLNSPFPEDEYVSADIIASILCIECHSIDKFEAPATKSTQFRDGERNLHYVHVYKEKGRRCIFCHSPHATNNEHLIRDKAKFGNFEFNLNYKSDSTGGSCFPGCHVERTYNNQ